VVHEAAVDISHTPTDEVCGTDDAFVIRDADRTLPRLHFVQDQITWSNNLVGRQIIAELVVVVITPFPRDYAKVPVYGQRRKVGPISLFNPAIDCTKRN
jgi:hypothetical protein